MQLEILRGAINNPHEGASDSLQSDLSEPSCKMTDTRSVMSAVSVTNVSYLRFVSACASSHSQCNLMIDYGGFTHKGMHLVWFNVLREILCI